MQSENQLIHWFLKNRKPLPWRSDDPFAYRNDYFVWISEIMLQQTQVAAVCDHFTRWILKFPTISDLAKASENEVLKYWQGLGYYSRAKNILKTAKILIHNYNGLLPQTRKELEALPGIGKYTAGAILSLARHQAEPILDGNLIRIFSRLNKISFLPDQKTNSDFYWSLAKDWSSSKKAFLINEALMELGRTCCKVKSPNCSDCPLKKSCKAFISNQTELYPPQKKKKIEDWIGLMLVIESDNGKIFFTSNKDSHFLKNQKALPHFEFPYSKTKNFPAQAEEWVSFDLVKDFHFCGRFKHSITRYKIDCNVLHILTSQKIDSKETQWVSKKKISKEIANSFSLKALKLAGI